MNQRFLTVVGTIQSNGPRFHNERGFSGGGYTSEKVVVSQLYDTEEDRVEDGTENNCKTDSVRIKEIIRKER